MEYGNSSGGKNLFQEARHRGDGSNATKLSMNNMSKMEYHGIAARTSMEEYEEEFKKAAAS
jgi:hypothetical protein